MFDKIPPTPGWREVMRLSKAEAGRLGHDYIGPEHYLLGVIRKGDGLAVQVLNNLDVDIEDLRLELERMLEIGKTHSVALFQKTAAARKVEETAKLIAQQMRHSWVGTEHLLLALLKVENTVAFKCLRNFKLDFQTVRGEVINLIEGGVYGQKAQAGYDKSSTPALDTFSRDLSQLAKEAKLDPVIGRENEIERILQILCRRTKNNPILLGEPGVGKTAIVEGLAQKIVVGDVPEPLLDKRVLCLDLAAIVAGTKYRGQFEERMKAIIQEIRRSRDVLIFIDELHTLVGAGAAEGAIDASNMLKPALSRGEIQCIGATTLEEYRKHVEKDGSLERRFQTIIVNSPTTQETVEILHGLRSRYEEHHNVVITDEAIKAAVYLTDRYVSGRALPDKAIDVVDESSARARLRISQKPQDIRDLEKAISELEEELRECKIVQEFEKCQELKLKRDQLQREKDRMMEEWRRQLAKETERPLITADDLALIISRWTGIPVSRLEEEESAKLLRIEDEITKRVVSQEEAICTVAKAIRRARSGLKDPRRPTGSFIFLGPTGVGKTELAKALAEFLFGNEDALIRVDMSEYMEKHAVSRLIGAPPGYVGYEEGGQLTEKVRRRPYSVVLLDEIEKAHPEVFSILLQVFDDGRLTDSWGHVVDFRNSIIIMTSNIGTRRFKKSGGLGFHAAGDMFDYDTMKNKVLSEVKKLFNPEFLNRLDETIVFKPLVKEDIRKIVDIMIRQLNERLKDRSLTLQLSEEAKGLLSEYGYDPEYGARPLRRTIQRYIEDPLAIEIIEGKVKPGDAIEAYPEGRQIKFRRLSEKLPAASASGASS